MTQKKISHDTIHRAVQSSVKVKFQIGMKDILQEQAFDGFLAFPQQS